MPARSSIHDDALTTCKGAFLARVTLVAAIIFTAPAAWAEKAEATGIGPSSGSIIASIFRMLGALAIVFAVFFLGIWLFRNWQGLLRQRGIEPKLRVLEFKSLGTRQALYVVGYERQRFLISSSSAGITMLTALPDGADEPVHAPVNTPAFAEVLLKALNKK